MKKILKVVSIVVIIIYLVDLRYSIYKIQNKLDITPSAHSSKLVEQKQEKAFNYIQKKQYDTAINECREILIMDPNNAIALERMGSCYYQLGQKGKALETWEKVIKIDPANEDVKKILKSFSKTEPAVKGIKIK